jgi:endonuclease YncB( thermonuclease family)
MERLRYKWFRWKYKKLNRGNVKPFGLFNTFNYCKVVDVIDGQTVIVIMDIGHKTYQWHLRLDGYKTYILEDISDVNMNKKSIISNSAAKAYNHLSYLINIEPNNIFKVKINGFTHDGILLGELYYYKNINSINKIMVKNGYGIDFKLSLSYMNQ